MGKKIFKLLAIGNSFSVDALEHFYKVLKSAGYEDIVLGNMFIGGAPLTRHLDNILSNEPNYEYWKNDNDEWVITPEYRLIDSIKDESWDFITYQQASAYSGEKETYDTLYILHEEVKKYVQNKDVKYGWHMTWAYEQREDAHPEFYKYNYNQQTMYQAITNAVKEKITGFKDISYMIPNGTTIQNIRTSFVGDNLTRDGFHLSLDLGRYAASLSLFKVLTELNLDLVSYKPDTLTKDQVNIVKKAVEAAVNHPFEITDMKKGAVKK